MVMSHDDSQMSAVLAGTGGLLVVKAKLSRQCSNENELQMPTCEAARQFHTGRDRDSCR